jgi:hypothetical protein
MLIISISSLKIESELHNDLYQNLGLKGSNNIAVVGMDRLNEILYDPTRVKTGFRKLIVQLTLTHAPLLPPNTPTTPN